MFLLLSSMTLIHGQQSSTDVSSEVITEKLFVIKVPIQDNNTASIEEMKGLDLEGVKIMEEDGHLTLRYLGTELRSEVSPDFIEDVSIYKGAAAKKKYPDSPEGGVMEIIVLDANTLKQVIYSITSYKG